MIEEKSLTYKGAGVNIDKADKFVEAIKNIAKSTFVPGVVGGIGGFSGVFEIPIPGTKIVIRLHSSTDGVGTKLKIAFMMDKHDTIGQDLVAMCVNDIIVKGVKPLFFLDYLSTGVLKLGVAKKVIGGIAEACRQAGCALIGGETAEMPGIYQKGEYDLAGFVVGLETPNSIKSEFVNVGDQLIGILSSGLHSNGYSLVRRICFEKMKLDIDTHISEFGRTLGEELLEPTKIYVNTILGLLDIVPVSGIAHITGGGIPGNVVRMLPGFGKAVLKKDSWDVPPIFKFLKANGPVEDSEMLKTFNNGLGLVVAVSVNNYDAACWHLNLIGEKYFHIGEVVQRANNENQVEWV